MADNGTLYEDNGISLYQRKTTAAADIKDETIGASISLVRIRNNNQQTTGVRRQPVGDGGGEIQQSALILGGGDGGRGLEES